MSAGPADPLAKLRTATNKHRERHGCGAYPYANGALLAALAGATAARRILELGTALGYTALSFARGVPDAIIDTIERDGEHVRLARENIAEAGLSKHVIVHEGDFAAVLKTLDPGYDLAFFDGFTPSKTLLAAITKLLRPGGTLITANLNHGGTADAVRAALADSRAWLTAFVDRDGETAISIKRADP